ncbi:MULTISPECIES: FAD-dependent oxidoreductase [unclassified Fusibacter]|uniref:FAD-dependent oxidoreductase n=1 Tax=unclassified Fusibacter TaxID=2624464 RepID=UPI00101143ED|nr:MULTISPECIES: FAD-dependent oxidoreductase [unclassified Fusibacter]MCK8060740.1 FAD-dependent oxidoreductase [Fusibacter sp. A2]NPE23036.1 FAD-dependent oxidoreductase [Fusibacter sp. A1]RXV59709.1 FAD-dependent oxidoreductase [Fusibacter sp. A1]
MTKSKTLDFDRLKEKYKFALSWDDVGNRPYREDVLALANKIGRTKAGTSREAIPFGPEYYAIAPLLDEYQIKVAMNLRFREKVSAKDISEAISEPYEKVDEALKHIAWTGLAFVNTINGVDMYWLDIFVPGHLEMINNNKELVEKHPEVALAFYYFGSKKGPMAAGIMPIGGGPMRVLPIERAIDGNSKKVSYEEISKHLNEASTFSVSDCSCRTSREAMGEGCGHLKEEMCVQLDHAAEYYIKTGRGREISREEAFDIIKRAEDNGLMHSVPNLDEPGHTHAICNCCGCGCYAMRLANEYLNNDIVRSNYKSEVEEDKCVACGECVDVCPTNALRLGQKLCSTDDINAQITKQTPRDTEWNSDKWNTDYRINRKNTMETGTAPCITKCPAHIPVQGYIKLASQGKYLEALELIKKHNPLPAVCGRVCPKLCEEDCTRGDIDEAVAVDDIKKFIAEKDLQESTRYVPTKRHDYSDKKIAIIGGGPSGLTCAYDLSIDGYDVTVFEKQARLGGMLTLGIPEYRLEKDVIEAEIDVLRAMGVKFETGIEIGKDIKINELRSKGFDAFYIAIGAHSGRKLNIEGEEAHGVFSGVDFLREINLGRGSEVSNRTIVIGGGNVAIDVARSAIRLSDVTQTAIYCLESQTEMPAHKEEIEEALDEGIEIFNGYGPARILTSGGKVRGVEFKKCLSVFDESGKFNPVFDQENPLTVECDHVLLSVGQTYDYGSILDGENIELTNRHTIAVDPITLQTSRGDIFAGGDVASGPKLAIDAIASGKEAAISLHRYVQNGQSLVFGRDNHSYKVLEKSNLTELESYDHVKREKTHHVDGARARETFKDLRGTFTEEQVKLETERCLGCGATKVDEYLCVGCGACTLKCKFDAISLSRVHNVKGYELKNLPKAVLKKVIGRKVKIAANRLNPFVTTR